MDLLAWRFAHMNWKRMETIRERQRRNPSSTALHSGMIKLPHRRRSVLDQGSNSSVNSHTTSYSPFVLGSSRRPGRRRKICSLPPHPNLVPGRDPDHPYSAECHLCNQTVSLRHKRDWRDVLPQFKLRIH